MGDDPQYMAAVLKKQLGVSPDEAARIVTANSAGMIEQAAELARAGMGPEAAALLCGEPESPGVIVTDDDEEADEPTSIDEPAAGEGDE